MRQQKRETCRFFFMLSMGTGNNSLLLPIIYWAAYTNKLIINLLILIIDLNQESRG